MLCPVLLAPSSVLTKSTGKHLQRPDEHECIVGSLNHDAGQAGADCVQNGACAGQRTPTLPLYDSVHICTPFVWEIVEARSKTTRPRQFPCVRAKWTRRREKRPEIGRALRVKGQFKAQTEELSAVGTVAVVDVILGLLRVKYEHVSGARNLEHSILPLCLIAVRYD